MTRLVLRRNRDIAVLLSEQHRFIFVHVPRTGGTSIKRALQPFCPRRRYSRWQRLLDQLGLIRDYRRLRFRTHSSLQDIERRIPGAVFASYFKFAVVRNPWDLLVSEYNYYFKGSELHSNRRRRRHRWRYQAQSFPEYVRARAERPEKLQFDRLSNASGTLGLDFVARFERLADDFQRICIRLGLDATLTHVNRSDRLDCAAYYDEATHEFVTRQWAKDIEAFDYAPLQLPIHGHNSP